MKYLIASIVLSFTASGFAAPARLVDSKPQFAVATVDGDPVFSSKEKDDEVATREAKGRTPVVVDVSPSATEITLSTTIGRFSNYSDFLACQTRAGLRRKYIELKVFLDVAQDLNDDFEDIRARIRWIKQYYQSLP